MSLGPKSNFIPVIYAGAKKIILTAPPKSNDIKMIVMGVNENILDGSEKIISIEYI